MGSIRSHSGNEPSPWALAAAQYGRVAKWQLEALGVGVPQLRSWLRSARLLPDRRGVYAVPGAPVVPETRWISAVLACGPRALLSHLSAAVHRGIWIADRTHVDVTAPRSRHPQPGIALHRPRTLPERHTHLGIPITSPTQILLDLEPTFTASNLDRAIGEAEILRILDAEELQARGGPKLRRLLQGHDDSQGIPRNVMERAFRTIVRTARLPEPEVDAELLGYEVDFLWRELGIAVETDGRSIHARRAAFARDRRKDRKLQLAGFLPLRFSYAEIVNERAVVTATLHEAFSLRTA